MKNLLFIPFLLILLKMSIINVIAAVSNVLVETENRDISIDLSVSSGTDHYDVQQLFFEHPEKKSSFFKTFSDNNSAFAVKVRAYAEVEKGADPKLCGTLEVYRHKKNINVVEYQFTPSPEIQITPECLNSGFELTLGDETNVIMQSKKILFSMKKKHHLFVPHKCYEKDKLTPYFDVLCNIIVYKDSTVL